MSIIDNSNSVLDIIHNRFFKCVKAQVNIMKIPDVHRDVKIGEQSPVLLVDMSCRIGSRDASRDKVLTLTDSSTPYPAQQQSGPRL